MATIDLPVLDDNAAMGLAWGLAQWAGLELADRDAVVHAVADQSDRIPFYIHHIVDWLRRVSGPITPAHVEEAVTGLLCDPQDPWEMRNYRERINLYYPPDKQPIALALLDAAATAEPLSFEPLFNAAKQNIVTEDREAALAVLDLLSQDHYLVKSANGAYSFRFPLIRRAWTHMRGLA
jgi:hypothetical protein